MCLIRVVYVSCNVHTQARDVGVLVEGKGGEDGCRYEIESLQGFDFFPQTGHVESVAVLSRVRGERAVGREVSIQREESGKGSPVVAEAEGKRGEGQGTWD